MQTSSVLVSRKGVAIWRIISVTFFIAASIVEGTTGDAWTQHTHSFLSCTLATAVSLLLMLQVMALGTAQWSGSHSSQTGHGYFLGFGQSWEHTSPSVTSRQISVHFCSAAPCPPHWNRPLRALLQIPYFFAGNRSWIVRSFASQTHFSTRHRTLSLCLLSVSSKVLASCMVQAIWHILQIKSFSCLGYSQGTQKLFFSLCEGIWCKCKNSHLQCSLHLPLRVQTCMLRWF